MRRHSITRPPAVVLSREEAAARLVAHHGLARVTLPVGAVGTRALLRERRCIQLDPLDPWGTNADLVALARVDGLARGDIYRHLLPGHAFEHFARVRCLLPAEAFPWYRALKPGTYWGSSSERIKRLPRGVLERVLEEVREHGPIAADKVTDHGSVKPLDWGGGWTGTSRAAAMALEVLWGRCEIVVCGRTARTKIYDIPERALPQVTSRSEKGFERWALPERVAAAGLLARTQAPTWMLLNHVRGTTLPDDLIAEGVLEAVRVEGLPKEYLAPAGFSARPISAPDDRMRILGPLDSLLWDRALVRGAFGFEYLWEVYKPAAQRRWGWYVCPLLHKGRFVGRIEGAAEGEVLRVRKIWRERGVKLDTDALDEALHRHAAFCGATRVVRSR